MFWKRPHDEISPPSVEAIRDSLADRLRLVFDFATLGAYEENEADAWDEHEASPGSTQRSPQAVALECRDRVRAKRPAAQPHTQAALALCESVAPAGATCSASQAASATALARRMIVPGSRRRHRAGHVPAAQQPCIWPG
jgi:hypothetical protein